MQTLYFRFTLLGDTEVYSEPVKHLRLSIFRKELTAKSRKLFSQNALS